MKKIIFTSLIVLTAFNSLQAQENEENKQDKKELIQKKWKRNDDIQTVFKQGRPLGFYFGWTTKPTELNNQLGISTGGEFALSFGRKLNLGVAAYGLISPVQSNSFDVNGDILYYDMAYGGFLIEPVIGSTKMVHLTIPLLLGTGGMTYHTAVNDWSNWDNHYNFSSGIFFVAEPGLNLELNLFKWMRFHAGVGYRFCGPGYYAVPANNELSGWSGNVGLKLGLF